MFVIVCPIGMKLWILFEIFIDQDTIGLKGLVVSEKNISNRLFIWPSDVKAGFDVF
jgi:hypothetical protein